MQNEIFEQTNADQQSENGSDRAISEQVRKAIVQNKTVSSLRTQRKNRHAKRSSDVSWTNPLGRGKARVGGCGVSLVGAGDVKK